MKEDIATLSVSRAYETPSSELLKTKNDGSFRCKKKICMLQLLNET